MSTKRTVTHVKRTLWIGTCPECGYRIEWTDKPAIRETRCTECKKGWIVPKEESFDSSEYGQSEGEGDKES